MNDLRPGENRLSDAEMIAKLVAAAPPLTVAQRAILAAQWRRDRREEAPRR